MHGRCTVLLIHYESKGFESGSQSAFYFLEGMTVMTESDTFETTTKTFLLGLSVGVLLATILKPRDHSHPTGPRRDIVDVASEDSFPASDPPAY